MTEETPQSRSRLLKNRIVQVIFAIVGLQTLYFSFVSHSTQLNEWPGDLADRSAYCRLESIAACHEGQWFGILKSRVAGNTGILKEICTSWADKPDAANARMISAADGDTLYLCKMKDPAKIDKAKARL